MIVDADDHGPLVRKIEEVVRDWASSPPSDRAGRMSEVGMEAIAELLGVETNGARVVSVGEPCT